MKKPFAPFLLAAVLCLSACSAQPTEPQHTSAPETPEVTVATAPTPILMPSPSKLPELATEQKPAPTSAPQQGSEPEKYIEATVSVFYCYNRWLDPDGNWINSGHVFYSVCGNCGGMGNWFDNECMHCGAIYKDRTENELFYTCICDPNDTSIIYSENHEPFTVK